MSSVLTLAPMQTGPVAGSYVILALPLLLLLWLMMSQRRRARAVQDFQSALVVGDAIVTTSGLYGRVVALDGDVATVELGPGVVVRLDRRAIGAKEPVPAGGNAPGGHAPSNVDPGPNDDPGPADRGGSGSN